MRVTAAPLVALALSTVAPLSIAGAQSAIEVDFFDDWARRAYRRGKTSDALRLFLRAHRAAPTPQSLFNIALVADLAGERELAYAFFEAYLVSGHGDEKLVARAKRRLRALARRLARIRVRTRPKGATIYVDRRELGAFGRTPRRIAVPEGEHTVTVELEGYATASRKVKATKGELAKVDVVMEPLLGQLAVDTVPPNGTVVVTGNGDRRSVGAGRAVVLPVGAYRLRYAPLGYQADEARVIIEPGRLERRRLVATPVPESAKGTLLVNASQGPAEVWIDGLRRAQTPARLELSPGAHRVELRAGELRWEGDVELIEGEVHMVGPKLQPRSTAELDG